MTSGSIRQGRGWACTRSDALSPHRAGPACYAELPRIPIPSTPVNKGKRTGAGRAPHISTARVSVHPYERHPHALAAPADLLAVVGDAEVEAPPALDMVPEVVVADV
jgi:hypothetical protein